MKPQTEEALSINRSLYLSICLLIYIYRSIDRSTHPAVCLCGASDGGTPASTSVYTGLHFIAKLSGTSTRNATPPTGMAVEKRSTDTCRKEVGIVFLGVFDASLKSCSRLFGASGLRKALKALMPEHPNLRSLRSRSSIVGCVAPRVFFDVEVRNSRYR